MPLALPGIIATAIFTFIVAWNDFLFALVLIGKDELKTLAIGINEFFHMAVVDWGLIMAAGVMVTIPALAFFIAVQRYLIAGWGAGGLKGWRTPIRAHLRECGALGQGAQRIGSTPRARPSGAASQLDPSRRPVAVSRGSFRWGASSRRFRGCRLYWWPARRPIGLRRPTSMRPVAAS